MIIFVNMKEKLLQAIEQRTGLRMQRNHDFTELSRLIFDKLHEYVSPSTLKRIWGYVDALNVKPRTSTLNILAQYLNCKDFGTFSVFGGG